MNFVIFVIAMAALIWGADLLVKESERIALKFNISEFIIGATLIALGTSLPEMAASSMFPTARHQRALCRPWRSAQNWQIPI